MARVNVPFQPSESLSGETRDVQVTSNELAVSMGVLLVTETCDE